MAENKISIGISAISALFALGSLIVAIIALIKSNLFSKNSLNKSEIQNLLYYLAQLKLPKS